jgi:hypothetical protein
MSKQCSRCLPMLKPAILALACLVGQSATAGSFRSDSGGLSFEFPGGWEHAMTDRTRTHYVENVMLQPRGQDFSGKPGQVIVRVFDPLYVLEQAKVLPYEDHARVFEGFVRSLPGEGGLRTTTQNIQGTTHHVARSSSQGVPVVYLGRVVSGGRLVVVAAAGTTAANAYHDQIVLDLLATLRLDSGGSSQGPVDSVRDWYAALQAGDESRLRALTCGKIGVMTDLGRFMGTAMGVGDPHALLMRGARLFDYAGLRFATIGENGPTAVVRVAGLVRQPSGRLVAFSQQAGTFGSNVLTVRKEGGAWRVCEPLRGGNL